MRSIQIFLGKAYQQKLRLILAKDRAGLWRFNTRISATALCASFNSSTYLALLSCVIKRFHGDVLLLELVFQ